MQEKRYICPFCAAELNKQEGFSEDLDHWKCIYCDNEVTLEKENEGLKRNVIHAETIWKKTRPVLELGVGLLLVGLGTAIAAAEYFIEKTEKREAMDDPEYETLAEQEEIHPDDISNNVL